MGISFDVSVDLPKDAKFVFTIHIRYHIMHTETLGAVDPLPYCVQITKLDA